MRVLILGGGVIGVTTAYYLAKAGAKVTVLERRDSVAAETSHANAGQISPGYSTPWAAPGIPIKALKWMFQRHAPLSIRPDGSLFQLYWLAQMLRNCDASRYAVNKERMLRLAQYSRDCLVALRTETDVRYEGRQGGTLQVFRNQAQLDALERDTRVLRESGVAYRVLDREGILKIEPGLRSVSNDLLGALQLPGDETGDCQLFTRELAAQAAALGVNFRFGVTVKSLITTADSVRGVATDQGQILADHVVLAAGSYSREILAPLGLKIPVYPLKGYSLTVPIVDPARAPRSTVMDETYKVAVTRFDQRIRVGGMAEVAGYDLSLNPRRRETLAFVLNGLFPGAGDVDKAEFWTGLRPMTPDGTPIVGFSGIKRLWLNTGHGTLGWTMAAGSGRLVCDLILRRKTDIDPVGLGVDRYGAPLEGTRRLPARPAIAA